MPPGCKLVDGRWYVVASNVHLARIIGELTGGKRSMPLAPNGKPGPTEKRKAREFYVHLFVRPLEKLVEAKGGTIKELVALAFADMLPTYKSKKGRDEAERYLGVIEKEFGDRLYARNAVEASTGNFLRTHQVQQYLVRYRDKKGHVAANRTVQHMSKMFQLAKSLWGKTEYNPCEGVTYNDEIPRDQLPSEVEFDAFYVEALDWMQCAMLISRDYARRRGEILGLAESDVTALGVFFRRGKPRKNRAQKKILMLWDDDLRALVERARSLKAAVQARTGVTSLRLFVNRKGQPVTETGWNSAWARVVQRVNREREAVGLPLIVRKDFHFHDLRAVKPSRLTHAEAQQLLAHDDPASTEVYRRGPIVIKGDFGKAKSA